MITISLSSNIIGLYVLMYIIWIITINSFRKNEIKSVKKEKDDNSLLLIRVSTIVSIIVALGCGTFNITVLSPGFFYLGIIFMGLGFLVREWAIITIGRFFSVQVRIYSDHKLVNEGLYRHIRHPAYTGALLTIIGLGIAFRSIIGLVFILIISSIAYTYRIKLEEKLLLNEFGDDYINYKKRTKRLIPGIF